jgi:basic membrane protein A and related proteins
MQYARSLVAALVCAVLIFALAACEPQQLPEATPGSPPPTTAARIGGVVGTPTPGPTATPAPTPTPTQVAVSAPARRTNSVGFVAMVDHTGEARLAQMREGLERATSALGVESMYAPTRRADAARTAALLAEAGYELVIVSSPATDVIEWAAKRYPQTKFVDFGRVPDAPAPNVMGVYLADDQAGFLAGALAGWLTESDMVAFVGAMPTTEIVKFRKGYEHGVQHVNPQAIVLGAYLNTFEAPDRGAAEAEDQLNEGADVLFAVGGETARGAMEAAAKRGVAVIGAEQDVYFTPDHNLGDQLVTSAVVRVDTVVEEVVKVALQGQFQPGNVDFDVRTGTVYLAGFRGWQQKLPERAYDHLQDVFTDLGTGRVKTNVEIPLY